MITIDTLTPEDLSETTELHLDHLSMGIFPKLGTGFMRCYQESFARSPYGVALVARDGEKVVGTLFGTTSNAAHYRWVVRNMGLQLGASGVLALLRRPALAMRFLTTRSGRYARAIMRRLSPSAQASSETGSGALSVLSHVVTAPEARRQGVGRKLVRDFARRAGGSGARRALLVTEEGGLGTPFFERIGARLLSKRHGQDGRMVREYRLMLGEAPHYERVERDRRGRALVRSFHANAGAGAGVAVKPGPVAEHQLSLHRSSGPTSAGDRAAL